MKRRSVLKRLCTAGVVIGIAGCSFGQSAEERLKSRYGRRFDSYVDIASAGADPAGDAVVDDTLEAAASDSRLLYFRSGRYRLGSLELSGLENAGLVAAPGADVTLVPATPATEMDEFFLEFGDVSDFLVDGIQLDFRADGYGGLTYVHGTGDVTIRNVEIHGVVPRNVIGFIIELTDRSATGHVENLQLPGGGHQDGNSVGIYVKQAHAGTVHFENCRVESFPNNGLYASSPGRDEGGGGQVHVRGGVYRNNNISNVRIGSDNSSVRNVTIEMDRVPPHEPVPLLTRGIRLRRGRGHLVADCDISIGPDGGDGFGGIVHHGDAGSTTVRDTTIAVDRDRTYAIRVSGHTDDVAQPATDGPDFRNVSVTGLAAGDEAVIVYDRDNTTFHGCSIDQDGEERDGMLFARSRDCVLADSQITVPGTPVRYEQADVVTRNLDTDGSSWFASSIGTEQLPPRRSLDNTRNQNGVKYE